MARKPYPVKEEFARIRESARNIGIRQMADSIAANPLAHSIKSTVTCEVTDFMDAVTIRTLESAGSKQRRYVLLEASRIAADCQHGHGIIPVLSSLFVYCDCIARHIMRTGIELSDDETVQLISHYGRRLDNYGAPSRFANYVIDGDTEQAGLHLFLRTVAPQVRRKSFVILGETKSRAAYRLYLDQAGLSGVASDQLAALRAVLDESWTPPPVPAPVKRKPPPPSLRQQRDRPPAAVLRGGLGRSLGEI